MAKVINIAKDGARVAVQAGSDKHTRTDENVTVTNIAAGGTVGIQCGHISGSVTVVQR